MGIPRIGVIGAGYWGKNIVRNLDQLGALACICDSSSKQLQAYKKTFPHAVLAASYKEVLSNPDISGVAIASPAALHGDMINQALEAGKDVYVEKPLCLSETEGARLISKAREKGLVLMVGHLLHYHEAVIRLKELVREGELGKIYYIFSSRLNLGKFRAEENVLWSFAPHDISVILSLAGEMPDEVSASGGSYLRENIADVTLNSMCFPSGVKANIFVSWLHPFKEQKLVVVGSKKMAVFDDTKPEDKLLLYPHTVNWKAQVPVPDRMEAVAVPLKDSEPLKAELSHFLKCITTRNTPLTDGEEGLRVLKVLQACQVSLDGGGKMVRLSGGKTGFYVHPTACVDEPVSIGEGTSIWHFSHVMKDTAIGKSCNIGQNVVISPGVRIGDSVKIQNNVSVYTGVTLEDGVFCGPSMVFTNVINPRSFVSRKHEYKDTLVKKGATLGANCTVLCGHTIGSYSFVGAGAVVTHDVPDYALVIGNPARMAGYVCECGVKLEFRGNRSECNACGATYFKDAAVVKRRG